MQDKTVLITGSTDGIGKQTAHGLARMGARILLHGRSQERCESTREEIIRSTGNNNVECVMADLASQKQVRDLAAQIHNRTDHLNVLINNAGVDMLERKLTEDGYEMTFAVNYLAPFLLTRLLMDLIQNGKPSRIINVSSNVHMKARIDFENLLGEKSFVGWHAYTTTKLALVLFTKELAERLKGSGITCNCLHPGAVDTKMLRARFPDFKGISLQEGAATSVYLASSPDVKTISGEYFDACKIAPYSPLADDPELRRKLWGVSEELTQAIWV
jgi:NAD(P)-dependent dehydrogenase (short-subunit alcohol dehydrogenase family)